MRTLIVAAALASLTLATSDALAHGPYVVLRDDGTLAGKVADPDVALKHVMTAYEASGAPRPEVLSVWTTFPMDKSEIETLFLPASNDVTGIGLEQDYGGDGTFGTLAYKGLRAVLLHNDVLALAQRAKLQAAPVDGFADYLFLLELSHVWGPAVNLPTGASGDGGVDGGASGGGPADELIGFPFHWSFWMDAGGSPAGGNRWKDNGDGTFTVGAQSPSDITYSMLDLYLMGLADPSEVTPFGVLENAVPPSGMKDPFTGGSISKQSFPYFGTDTFTVHATRRSLTIDDVIQANGARVPARSAAPKSFKYGIALMLPASATDDDVAKAQAVFDPIAPTFVPAFARATRGRGSLELVTPATEDTPDAGGGQVDAGPMCPDGSSCGGASGCALAPGALSHGGGLAAFALGFVALAARLRRRFTAGGRARRGSTGR